MMREGSGESLWESESHRGLHWLAPKRGAQPRARLLLPLFCFESGVNRGRGSGFINKFGNSAKSITFVVWVQR